MQAMIAQCPDSVIGLRDAALLALGFAAALRRSELCGLRVDDVTVIPRTRGYARRMLLTIRRSKTDRNGKGRTIPIPEGRLIARVQAWLAASGITQGPLFQAMKRGGSVQERPLHHSDVPWLVKRYAALIGMDPKEVAGHSLRAGFVTSAAAHRARLDKIMAVTRHTNPATVMKYIRDVDAFIDHAGAAFLQDVPLSKWGTQGRRPTSDRDMVPRICSIARTWGACSGWRHGPVGFPCLRCASAHFNAASRVVRKPT